MPPLGDEGMRALANLGDLESLAVEDYYGGGRKGSGSELGNGCIAKTHEIAAAGSAGNARSHQQDPGQYMGIEAPVRAWTSILLAIASTHHLTTLRRTSWH